MNSYLYRLLSTTGVVIFGLHRAAVEVAEYFSPSAYKSGPAVPAKTRPRSHLTKLKTSSLIFKTQLRYGEVFVFFSNVLWLIVEAVHAAKRGILKRKNTSNNKIQCFVWFNFKSELILACGFSKLHLKVSNFPQFYTMTVIHKWYILKMCNSIYTIVKIQLHDVLVLVFRLNQDRIYVHLSIKCFIMSKSFRGGKAMERTTTQQSQT